MVVIGGRGAVGGDRARRPLLARAPVLLVVSTLAACVAVAALAVQPWLRRRIPAHLRVGGIVAVLVAVHVLALVVEDPDDTLYSMSRDGPTRARMALIATVLLVVVTRGTVVLLALRGLGAVGAGGAAGHGPGPAGSTRPARRHPSRVRKGAAHRGTVLP
jgi:hypothetical protein